MARAVDWSSAATLTVFFLGALYLYVPVATHSDPRVVEGANGPENGFSSLVLLLGRDDHSRVELRSPLSTAGSGLRN